MITQNLVGLVFNSQIPNAAELVESLASALGIRDSSWTSSAADVGDKLGELRRTKLIITAGGDGTILRTLRVSAHFGIPIVGVNMGRVGFMTEVRVEDATLGADDTVLVRRSAHVARFLRADPPSSFYDSLTQRLSPVYRTRVDRGQASGGGDAA